MSIQILGSTSGIALDVDGNIWKAAKVTDRPAEYGSGGFYVTVVTGTTAASPAANAPLVSFRWTNPALVCLIRQIETRIIVTTAGTGIPELAGFVARNFTVSDTGGAVAAPSRKRSTMPNSTIGDFRFANAGVLTAGTRTLDTQSFIDVSAAVGLGAPVNEAFPPVGTNGEHPIVLVTNEGLVFNNQTTLTTTVYRYTITIHHAEVPAF